MQLTTFDEFQSILAEFTSRREIVWEEITEMNQKLASLQTSFDEQVLEGADPEEIQFEIETLQRGIAIKEREAVALESAITGKAKTGKIHQAAKKVWHEGTEIITQLLRKKWDQKLVEVEKKQKEYLSLVADLGKIQKEAESVSSKLSYGLEGFLPPAGVPHLSTQIYPERFIGVIFLDYEKVRNAYQKGGKK